MMGLGLLWRLREGRIIARVAPRSAYAVSAAAAATALVTSRALYRAGAGATAAAPHTTASRVHPPRVGEGLGRTGAKAITQTQAPVTLLRDAGQMRALARLATWANASYEAKPDADGCLPAGARLLAGPFAATETLPVYVVGVDDALGAIVVSIRGSQGWGEALVSMQAVPVDVPGGTAHRGILAAADALVSTLATGVAGSAQPRRETIASLCARAGLPEGTAIPPSLIMCGHSLGAAVASLSALRLQNLVDGTVTATVTATATATDAIVIATPPFPFSRAAAIAFCAPPCVSPALARSMSAFTTVIVSGDDAVPRMHFGAVRRLRAELATVDWAQELSAALAAGTARSVGALTFGVLKVDAVGALRLANAAKTIALRVVASAVAPTAHVLRAFSSGATTLIQLLPAGGAALLAVSVDVLVEWARASVGVAALPPARYATGSALASALAAIVGPTPPSLTEPTRDTDKSTSSAVHWPDFVHCVPGRIVWLAYPGAAVMKTPTPRLHRRAAAKRCRRAPTIMSAVAEPSIAPSAAAAAARPPPQAQPRSRRGHPLFLIVHHPDDVEKRKSGIISAVPATASRTPVSASGGGGRVIPLWRRAALPGAFAVLAARLHRDDKKAARLDAAAFTAERGAAFKLMEAGGTAAGHAALYEAQRVAAAVGCGGRALWPHRHLSLLEMSHTVFSDHLISNVLVRFQRAVRPGPPRCGTRKSLSSNRGKTSTTQDHG